MAVHLTEFYLVLVLMDKLNHVREDLQLHDHVQNQYLLLVSLRNHIFVVVVIHLSPDAFVLIRH